jgi:hypothetical protein
VGKKGREAPFSYSSWRQSLEPIPPVRIEYIATPVDFNASAAVLSGAATGPGENLYKRLVVTVGALQLRMGLAPTPANGDAPIGPQESSKEPVKQVASSV